LYFFTWSPSWPPELSLLLSIGHPPLLRQKVTSRFLLALFFFFFPGPPRFSVRCRWSLLIFSSPRLFFRILFPLVNNPSGLAHPCFDSSFTCCFSRSRYCESVNMMFPSFGWGAPSDLTCLPLSPFLRASGVAKQSLLTLDLFSFLFYLWIRPPNGCPFLPSTYIPLASKACRSPVLFFLILSLSGTSR